MTVIGLKLKYRLGLQHKGIKRTKSNNSARKRKLPPRGAPGTPMGKPINVSRKVKL